MAEAPDLGYELEAVMLRRRYADSRYIWYAGEDAEAAIEALTLALVRHAED